MNTCILTGLVVAGLTLTGAARSQEAKLPCPIDTDIWVLAGQSNMQGSGVVPKDSKPDPRIMMLNMDNTWITAQEPVHRMFESVAPIHKSIITQSWSITSDGFEQSRSRARRIR